MSDYSISGIANTAMGGVSGSNNANRQDPTGFGRILEKTIEEVNGKQIEAENAIAGLVSGQHSNIHETMIAMEKANVSFRLLTKAQNKILGAYQEIMRMQL